MTAEAEHDTPPIRLRVGNDVVDLRHPRCRSRPAEDRLPGRILTPHEMEWFSAPASDPLRLRRLWSLWAAKETAFKVVSKLRGEPPVFRHRAFAATLSEKDAGGSVIRLEGRVRWKEHQVPVEGISTPNFVHLTGWGGELAAMETLRLETGVEGWADPDPDGGGQEDIPGEQGIRRLLSRRARRVALARLASYLEEGRSGDASATRQPRIRILTSAERPGRTPPRVEVDGRIRRELDLSLSHHGRYVGWALLLPR